jgi:hypothetical protein
VATLASETVRAEVRCFALPTAHGELGRLSPSGLQVLLRDPAPPHLEPGCEVEVRLFDEREPGPAMQVPGVVARLDQRPGGEQLLVLFLRGLPPGEPGERFLRILDRRGATRVGPPQPTALWVCPPGFQAALRGEVIDLSADGLGLSLADPALRFDGTQGLWSFELDLGPSAPPLRLAGRLKRSERRANRLQLGFRLEHGTDSESMAGRARLLELLRRWRG